MAAEGVARFSGRVAAQVVSRAGSWWAQDARAAGRARRAEAASLKEQVSLNEAEISSLSRNIESAYAEALARQHQNNNLSCFMFVQEL